MCRNKCFKKYCKNKNKNEIQYICDFKQKNISI